MEEEELKQIREENQNLTYDEILEILEAELYDSVDSPYKPLNFHDDNEDY